MCGPTTFSIIVSIYFVPNLYGVPLRINMNQGCDQLVYSLFSSDILEHRPPGLARKTSWPAPSPSRMGSQLPLEAPDWSPTAPGQGQVMPQLSALREARARFRPGAVAQPRPAPSWACTLLRRRKQPRLGARPLQSGTPGRGN